MKIKGFQTIKQYIITGVIGILGGVIFKLLHIPVPWLLGPMVAIVIGTNGFKWEFTWNAYLRNIGLAIIGYTIGLSMTAQALKSVATQIPYMFFMTVALLLLCAVIALFISNVSDNNFNTSLLASIPGGLSQVLILAEETKGINLAVVTITQIIRLMLIIVSMPILVLFPFFQGGGQTTSSIELAKTSDVSLFPSIFLFIAVALIFIYLFVKIKFPTAVLLGPMLGTILLQLAGINGPELPNFLTNSAQLLIGIHVGLMLNIADVPNKLRTITLAFLSGILLVTGSIFLSFLLTYLQPLSHATSLLSLAPGGMDQMGVIAHAIGADLSIVSGYQLFRTFFIFFAVPPMVKWFFSRTNNNVT